MFVIVIIYLSFYRYVFLCAMNVFYYLFVLFLVCLRFIMEPTTKSMNVYGEGITSRMLSQKITRYKAVVEPALLPATIEGSFGLVWDGDSIYGMNGSLGNYMQYISHHKLSLYILAGLPIIVSCSAGSAPLVKRYKIGFCVSSLLEINNKINRMV